MPLDLSDPNEDKLYRWLKQRSVPKNRAYVDNMLNMLGLNINRPIDLVNVSKALSLNDCYWIVEESYTGTYEDNNLYDNRFSRVLGEIAFTGYGSTKQLITSSPNIPLMVCYPNVGEEKMVLYVCIKLPLQALQIQDMNPIVNIMLHRLANN